MIYAFVCVECGMTFEHPHHPENPCPCGGRLRRDWRHVGVRRDMGAHWNHSVGAWVRNRREFTDALKRKGDDLSERLGTEHRFAPVEAGDSREAGGVTDEGLDLTRRAARDGGRTEPTKRVFT